MTKKQKHILLIIVTIVCAAIVFLQYQHKKSKHERLLTMGKEAPIIVKPYTTNWGDSYVSYYFYTSQGQRIEQEEKCGRDYNKYLNAIAIYNPLNPFEYELSFDFENYSTTWLTVFFVFIYLPVMTYVIYYILKIIISLYIQLKK